MEVPLQVYGVKDYATGKQMGESLGPAWNTNDETDESGKTDEWEPEVRQWILMAKLTSLVTKRKKKEKEENKVILQNAMFVSSSRMLRKLPENCKVTCRVFKGRR